MVVPLTKRPYPQYGEQVCFGSTKRCSPLCIPSNLAWDSKFWQLLRNHIAQQESPLLHQYHHGDRGTGFGHRRDERNSVLSHLGADVHIFLPKRLENSYFDSARRRQHRTWQTPPVNLSLKHIHHQLNTDRTKACIGSLRQKWTLVSAVFMPSTIVPLMLFSIGTPAHSELLIRKSRFIGCVQAVPDRAAAQAVVNTLRLEHPGAVHVCWALLAGGESAAVDDGEPSGTAGRPMLEVLRHHNLDGVLATVVRYFGGVKLGAGGLVRAYADCVAQAMLTTDKVPLQRWTSMHCSVPYSLEGLMRHLLEHADTRLGQVNHSGTVNFSFTTTETAVHDLVARLNEATHGRIVWLDANA